LVLGRRGQGRGPGHRLGLLVLLPDAEPVLIDLLLDRGRSLVHLLGDQPGQPVPLLFGEHVYPVSQQDVAAVEERHLRGSPPAVDRNLDVQLPTHVQPLTVNAMTFRGWRRFVRRRGGVAANPQPTGFRPYSWAQRSSSLRSASPSGGLFPASHSISQGRGAPFGSPMSRTRPPARPNAAPDPPPPLPSPRRRGADACTT